MSNDVVSQLVVSCPVELDNVQVLAAKASETVKVPASVPHVTPGVPLVMRAPASLQHRTLLHCMPANIHGKAMAVSVAEMTTKVHLISCLAIFNLLP